MIVVSAVLVVAAFGLLIAGITLPLMVLVYVSIGVSVLAALLLGAGAFKRRGELFGTDTESGAGTDTDSDTDSDTESSAEGETLAAPRQSSRQDAVAVAAPAAPVDPRGGAHDARPEPQGSATAAGTATAVPSDAPVVVVPSRRTYHLASCRQLRTHEKHELAHAEALEHGYVACSSCMPDTVLAARGPAASDTSQEDATSTVVDEDDVDPTEPASDEAAESDSDTHAGLVGVVSGSHRYHRLTCAVVEDAVNDGIELTTMGRDEAEAEECTRCTVCRP